MQTVYMPFFDTVVFITGTAFGLLTHSSIISNDSRLEQRREKNKQNNWLTQGRRIESVRSIYRNLVVLFVVCKRRSHSRLNYVLGQ